MSYLKIPLFLAFLMSFISLPAFAEQGFGADIKSDYAEFYSANRFSRMGIVFSGGAILANSKIDENFQYNYQNKTRTDATNAFSVNSKLLGEHKYLLPLSLISAGVSHYLGSGSERSGIGKWGERTARAYFVGGPTVLATQLLTGASRPHEDRQVSDWKPFNDVNGVSGHAFVGALPLLTIAYMNKDNAFIKYSAYLASTFTAASRINDNQHYLSQAILGWYLAWESVEAVYNVDSKEKKLVTIWPILDQDSVGVQLSMNW
jgi:membrane-associated phospholipid phosphatase